MLFNLPGVRHFFRWVNGSYARVFCVGIAGGAGLELFKIHFQPKPGINYYKIFKRNNLQRELEKYEATLIETEKTLIEYAERKKSSQTKQ